jgi:hypothetical protein
VALPLAYLWLVFFLDTQFHLPYVGRVLASLGVIAGVAWAVRHLVGRWRTLRLSEDEVALAIERQTPGRVDNRLINAVQLARIAPMQTRHLSDAVIQENYERLQQIRLEQAARLRPALWRAGLAVAVIVIGLAFLLWEPAHFANAAARILLPLAPIDPLYRTRLDVDPGDVEAAGDIPLRITIHGERPATLTILKRTHGKLTTERLAVDADDGPVTHTFRDVAQSFVYSVRGGDFTSPYFQVSVPQRIALARLRVTYRYPAYTALGEKTVEALTGELEALEGTQAQVTFVLDQPADRVRMLLDRPASKAKSEPRELSRSADGKEFTTEIALQQVHGYRLEAAQGTRAPQKLGPFPIRVVKDQEPKLELAGLERRSDVQVDSILPLKITASDDFGLVQVGLFKRRAADLAGKAEEPWEAVELWDAGKKTGLQLSHELPVAKLNAAEGDKIELALRATDTDPNRQGVWTTGAIHELSVGGEGAGLQRQYEQILRSEAELKGLIAAEEAQLAKVLDWLKKLDGQGDLRWDDPKNVDVLHKAVAQLATDQATVQKLAAQTVRSMPAHAGNVRIAVGLLADSEMVRAQRILDSVPGRAQPSAKRAALADARLTQERIIRSLQDLAEQYAVFRGDWELANMVPFTKMLAERQTKMRDRSKQLAVAPPTAADEFHRLSMQRRQTKVQELCRLITPAFAGLSQRINDQDADLAKAYGEGATTLSSDALQQPMQQAADKAKAGRWSEVARHQTTAAQALTDLHDRLRAAQLQAAQKAIAALKEKAKSNVAAQKELEKLQPGSSEAFVKDFPDGFKVEDMVRVWEVAGRKKGPGDGKDEPEFKKTQLMDYDRNRIELKEDSGVRQDPYSLTLAKQPGKTVPLKYIPTDKEKNKVKPFIQEDFDDLVGKLLEEADELHKNYQSLNLSTNQNNNDPGDIGKMSGALNSTGAVAATGNQKPPTLESGGVSRTGRQGARAYGMVADEDTFNRKGRDKALEGQAEVADQAGRNRMKKSDENQTDFSTGVGGKKIESDDSHFSLHDAGKWKDEYTKRMEKPQKKEYIVERQGDKFDAKMAAQLRDLTSKQEQVIERLKAIKKELKNLYLPTDHIDDLAASLVGNFESLKDRPDPELFRLQLQALERLRGSLRLFQNAGASFQPSLPRDRVIQGRVLDAPDRPTLPGYEEAVRQYYLTLATK